MLPMVRTICVLSLHQTISSSAPSPWQSPLVTAQLLHVGTHPHGMAVLDSLLHRTNLLLLACLTISMSLGSMNCSRFSGNFAARSTSNLSQQLVWLTTVTPFEFELLESVSLAFNIVPSLADSLPSSLKISLHSSSLSPYVTSNSLLSSCMNV